MNEQMLIEQEEMKRRGILYKSEIEGVSPKVYTELLAKAQKQGKIDKNADPAMFAFFFDSLLMMVQFSYSCDNYKERMKLYCGEDIFQNSEKMVNELTRFLLNALHVRFSSWVGSF